MTVDSNVFIYCIRCPFTNDIRYIGQTKLGKKRFFSHYSSKGNYPISNWIRKLRKSGNRPIFEVIEYCNIDELNDKEIYYISLYENLLNLTSGGTNNIMSINHNSIKLKGNTLESYYGKEKSENIKSKISEGLKGDKNPNYMGRTCTDEWKRNQSLSQSKSPIVLINTITNEEFSFLNSKKASKFIKCSPSTIREGKRCGYTISKVWKVKNNTFC